jgi:hypothetical protein
MIARGKYLDDVQRTLIDGSAKCRDLGTQNISVVLSRDFRAIFGSLFLAFATFWREHPRIDSAIPNQAQNGQGSLQNLTGVPRHQNLYIRYLR